MKNEDVSKNAALIPPSFGSPSADALGTGTYLTPNLAPGGMAVGTISGGNMPIVFPPTSGENTRQYQLWQFWRIQYLWRLYLCDR